MNKNLEDKIMASEGRTAEKISTLEQNLIQKITDLDEKTHQLARENAAIKEQNHLLAERISQMERVNRKNNIMVTGAKISNLEEAKATMDRLSQEHARDFPKIHNVRLIATKLKSKVIGTCDSLEHKIHIMRQRKDITGTEGEKLFIDDDLTKEDSRIQYLARQVAKGLRQEGKKVVIRDDKMAIDDQWWQYDHDTEKFSRKLEYSKV